MDTLNNTPGVNTERERMKVKKLDKYKENLYIKYNGEYGKIYSYNTLVALIDYKERIIFKTHWEIEMNGTKISSSPTTSKHINYVADELDSGMFMATASETKNDDFVFHTMGTYDRIWEVLGERFQICKCDLYNLRV